MAERLVEYFLKPATVPLFGVGPKPSLAARLIGFSESILGPVVMFRCPPAPT
jgi:hypothetical protein